MHYDYLIVGAGLFGAVFAREMAEQGKHCCVIDRRSHIGGNVYTETLTDPGLEGIALHKYGAHIFHTHSREIWDYVNRFAEFNGYINSPIAIYHNPDTDQDELYNLPFNMNTFAKLYGVTTPMEAKAAIAKEIEGCGLEGEPQNLEEQGMRLGKTVFTKLVKDYTEKQWQRPCSELPASTIKRLPFRFRYDNNYFNDRYQGIPIGGYTPMVTRMLAHDNIAVQLSTDFATVKTELSYDRLVYTGQIDAYYDFCYGPLSWRTVRFEHEVHDTDNYQGVAVVNYTSHDRPWTRMIEHKLFEIERVGDTKKTIVSKEFSQEWNPGLEPYYPVRDETNTALFEKYSQLAAKETNVIFGGRLGNYQYYDMDDCILAALEAVHHELT